MSKDVFYKVSDEYEIWHRQRAKRYHYSNDIDNIEFRSDGQGSLWMSAVIEHKRFRNGQEPPFSDIQKRLLISVAEKMELPLFIVFYQLPNEEDYSMPDKFLIKHGNKMAKSHLEKYNVPEYQWIDEGEFIRFLDTMECLIKMMDGKNKK